MTEEKLTPEEISFLKETDKKIELYNEGKGDVVAEDILEKYFILKGRHDAEFLDEIEKDGSLDWVDKLDD